jgi:hypothetical protein
MMPEATGTVGAGAPPSDTAIAEAGGGKFMARLAKIAEAKDGHDAAREASEKALADLNLGKSAAEAHKAATADRADAAKALETARRSAAQTIAAAEARATAIVKEATQQAVKTRGEATTVLDQAKAEAATLKTAAAEHHDAAQATRTEVANLKDELGQLRETMAGAIASAVAKEQQAEAALADLQKRHDILTEAMRRAAPPK